MDIEIPRIAPEDVADFLSQVMTSHQQQERIYEISGPQNYSSLEIVKIFGEVSSKEVTLQGFLPKEWESTLLQIGFSKDGAKNLMQMTQVVIDEKTKSETSIQISFSTDFKTYLFNKI